MRLLNSNITLHLNIKYLLCMHPIIYYILYRYMFMITGKGLLDIAHDAVTFLDMVDLRSEQGAEN